MTSPTQQASEAAKEYADLFLDRKLGGLENTGHTSIAEDFLAGAQWQLTNLAEKGVEGVKFDTHSIEANVVQKWSEHWFDPGINEEDTKNYRRRILSVDANMRYSIARMFSGYALPVLAKINQLQEQVERLTTENARLKSIRERFKVHGTDGCPTCDDGRITLYYTETGCMDCKPQEYKSEFVQSSYQSLTARITRMEEALRMICEGENVSCLQSATDKNCHWIAKQALAKDE